MKASQSLWSRDYFLINRGQRNKQPALVAIPLEQGLFFNPRRHRPVLRHKSQSLWSRDYFLMEDIRAKALPTLVAIPLEQGLWTKIPHFKESQSLWSRDYFLIWYTRPKTSTYKSQSLWSRDYFLMQKFAAYDDACRSQSLWSRDYFLMQAARDAYCRRRVAIPLEQGLFFNSTASATRWATPRRNPFGAGTIF